MKLAEALWIIGGESVSRDGFRVTFWKTDGTFSISGFFPDRDERPFETEAKAWVMARLFAERAPSDYHDIYVIHAKTFVPVSDYNEKRLRPMWPSEEIVENIKDDETVENDWSGVFY